MELKDLHDASLLITEPFELELAVASELSVEDQLEKFKKVLANRIYYLLTHNLDQLKGILYRIDVQEQRVLKIVSEFSLEEAAIEIAALIIERQLQKVETRKKYSKGNNQELNWDLE